LQTSLQTAEAKLQDLLRERDEVLKRIEDAIQQLDRIHQHARM
jgi:exonuclease VII small subunit